MGRMLIMYDFTVMNMVTPCVTHCAGIKWRALWYMYVEAHSSYLL